MIADGTNGSPVMSRTEEWVGWYIVINVLIMIADGTNGSPVISLELKNGQVGI